MLCLVYAALAALPAAPGSRLVLAAAGGSPSWLIGPLRPLGTEAAAGRLAGPVFFGGLCLALVLYACVLVRARAIPARLALGAVAALHVAFLLAPPLLSQDVFSYLAYARLGVEHGLNPYGSAPVDIPADPVFPYAGSKDAPSVYGPLFTLLTYPLAPLGLAAGLWSLKALAALSSLGIVLLVWRGAELCGRDPRLPALAVGLNPDVLVHVVGGAHNEALVMLLVTAGVVAFMAGRAAAGTGAAALASGLKTSAALVVPFLALGARRRRGRAAALPALLAAGGAGLAIALAGLLAFGPQALDALAFINSNQGRTSSFSLPYKTAELLGALLPGDRLDYRAGARAGYALGFLLALCWLLWRTWRGADPIAMSAWATLALLLGSAWLVPWYLLWLLPLAALSSDRRLLACAVALTAWTLPIAIPFWG